VELPSAGRGDYLAAVCGDDSLLRQRVEGLLRAHERPNELLDHTIEPPGETMREQAGTVIGPYKLLETIGEGGFGVVYMAEQTHPVRRKVALKVLKPGMDTRQVVARFEAERQALAMMDHPNIAHVFDGGETGSGRPYFVMELVRGVSVTDYCDEHHLSIHDRLGLFLDVCAAVQHAHQKGIIHRDLKPANVLVTMHDDRPVAKVIDFGIAKAIGPPLTDKTLFTNFAQFIGTPLYMSPEQAQLSGLDVDTRSDVYSLGVLLYELLTGTTPFDAERLRCEGFDEVRRIIREEEPAKPSTRMSTLGQKADTLSANRGSDPVRLRRQLRGELDWIAMKALEKDRSRRYESASAFAADVQRYLKDEPVLACPPSLGYRLGKFARRNRGALAAGTAIAAALVVGAAMAMWQAVAATWAKKEALAAAATATAAQDAAEKRAAETAAVLRFVEDRVFAAARPQRQGGGLGREVSLRQAIDAAVPFVDKSFATEPLIEARLRMTLGQSFIYLGEPAQADEQTRKASSLYSLHVGPEHADTLRAMHQLANCLDALGKRDEATRLREQTLEAQTRTLGADHPDTMRTANDHANSLADLGRHDEAIRLHQQTLRSRQRVLGGHHDEVYQSKSNLSISFHALRQYDDARALREEVFAARKTRLGPDHPDTLLSMNNLANTYSALGLNDEALALLQQTLAVKKASIGADHPDTLLTMQNLATTLSAMGRRDEALQLREETLAVQKRKPGPKHPDTLKSMHNLAASYHAVGRLDEALALRRETWKLRKSALGADHPDTLNTMSGLAGSLCATGCGAEAVSVIDECLRLAGDRPVARQIGPGLIGLRMRHFQKLGDADGCRATAEMWKRVGRTDAQSHFLSARLWAAAAGVSRAAPDADRAMECLHKALAAGFRDTDRLAKEPDLAPLRGRADFQQLLPPN